MKKIIFITAVLAFLVGCSSDGLQVQNISGTITYQGKPVSDAVVTFVALSAGVQGASGISNSDGSYVLVTPGAQKGGVMIGEYHVFISKMVAIDSSGKPISNQEPNVIPQGHPDLGNQNKESASRLLTSLIPEKYNNPSKPILKATIVKGNNEYHFQLED